MLNNIQNFIKLNLPAKHRTTPSGWTSFNCPCCNDNRGRGGFHFNVDGSFSYHCFNCNYKTSYHPGRHLNFKLRKLLSLLNISDSEIKRLTIEAIRIKDLVDPDVVQLVDEKIEFEKRSLPEDARSFDELVVFNELADWKLDYSQLSDAVKYVFDRHINLQKYKFYLSAETKHHLNHRIIIPCYWENEIIGYVSRAIVDDIKPKYFSNYDSNFVFNVNMQRPNSKFVIVCEGAFDAMAIDGVAVLGNEISEKQADIIDQFGKEVVVVFDNDKAGIKMIDSAIKYGWSVSFPIWLEECKDISEAVKKFGKMFVLKSIIDSIESSKLKIELKKKLHAV